MSEHARTLREQYALPEGTELIGVRRGVTEVVVAPRSELIGLHLFPGMVTPSGDLVVLAVQRGGEDLVGRRRDAAGGRHAAAQRRLGGARSATRPAPTCSSSTIRRGCAASVPLGVGAKRAIVILAAMVVLLATGLVPAAIAGLAAASALVLTRVVTPTQAYRSVSWTTVVLVAGMIPLSTAFITTGTADVIASGLLGLIGDASPYLALAAMCVLTMVLGQLISNTATVLIVAPIAVVVAADLGVSVLPFMMALTVSGAASFLTPVATPANTMVLEPGGYRFGDYWKLGLPLLLLFLLVAVFYVPLVWPF